MRIPSERGQTKASTRNCERKPTTRRATGARKSGRKVVTVDPMHTKAQSWNSNLIRGPCSSSGRGPVRFRRLLNLRNRQKIPLCPRPRRFAAQLVASRAEARRVCCSRGWVQSRCNTSCVGTLVQYKRSRLLHVSPPPCLVFRLTPIGGMAACCRCTQVRTRDRGMRSGILFSHHTVRCFAMLACSALLCLRIGQDAGLARGDSNIYSLVSMILK